MPTIKLTAEGKVITKGGLPSCTCCGECGCDGPWGPGYDSLPETVQVKTVFPEPEGIPTTYIRTGKCIWESTEPADPGQLSLSSPCTFWQIGNMLGTGYKDGIFDDGPTGYYLYFGGSGIEYVVLVE